MTELPGKHLGDVWRTISYDAKEVLVRRIAGIWAELFRRPKRGIGNIYSASSEEEVAPEIGRFVSMQFFWGNHQDVPRAPFSSSREWMVTRLALYEYECNASLKRHEGEERDGMDSDDEEEAESAERTLDIMRRLKLLVDRIFPVDRPGEEQSVFLHHDLSNHNVLVDDDVALTGLLDWECVSAVPLWKACDFPDLLVEKPREVKPDQMEYDLNDEDSAGDYWRFVKEYELTKLRRVFLDEMARLEPGWMEIFNISQMQRDLDYAVLYCDSELSARDMCYWRNDVVAGRNNMLGLEDRNNGFYGPNDSKDAI